MHLAEMISFWIHVTIGVLETPARPATAHYQLKGPRSPPLVFSRVRSLRIVHTHCLRTSLPLLGTEDAALGKHFLCQTRAGT